MFPILEVGKTYSFETVTFYYIGTVEHLFPTHARINNAHKVFEQGPLDTYFKGQVLNKERIPDGTLVPLGAGVVIMPYDHVIL